MLRGVIAFVFSLHKKLRDLSRTSLVTRSRATAHANEDPRAFHWYMSDERRIGYFVYLALLLLR